MVYTEYSYSGATNNSPWEWESVPNTPTRHGYCEKKGIAKGREHWMQLSPVIPSAFHSSTDVSGNECGLLSDFNAYRDETWMCGESDNNPSAKSIDEIESEQMP